MNSCSCDGWKKSFPQLEACVDSARIHGSVLDKITYTYWKYCPWCSSELIEEKPQPIKKLLARRKKQ